jgi:hypothetical protein
MTAGSLSDEEIDRLIENPNTGDQLRKALLVTQVARATPGGLTLKRLA